MEEIICYCSGVSKNDIVKAIRNGATTLDDIREATGACTLGQCKTLSPIKKCCSPVILEILKEYSQTNM